MAPSFLPGQPGRLFRKFGLTLAMAVAVALPLCPVRASRLVRAAPVRLGLAARLGACLAAVYARILRAALAVPLVVALAADLFCATAVLVAMGIRQQLTPRQDRAVALLSLTTARGVTLDHTDAQIRALGAAIAPRAAAGAVRKIYATAGTQGRATRGFIVLTLAPRGERARSERKIVGDINRRIAPVIGARAFAIQPDALGIRGAGRGLTFAVVGGTGVAHGPVAGERVRRLKQDTRMGPVRLNVYTPKPQRFIEASRDRAAALGTDIAGRGEALQAVLDGRRVGQAFVVQRPVT